MSSCQVKKPKNKKERKIMSITTIKITQENKDNAEQHDIPNKELIIGDLVIYFDKLLKTTSDEKLKELFSDKTALARFRCTLMEIDVRLAKKYDDSYTLIPDMLTTTVQERINEDKGISSLLWILQLPIVKKLEDFILGINSDSHD